MKPENSSASDRGRGQQREDKTGKTTPKPDPSQPPGSGRSVGRMAAGESNRREAEDAPGKTKPQTSRLASRPSQGPDRGLHR